MKQTKSKKRTTRKSTSKLINKRLIQSEAYLHTHLWDEITKSIAKNMPEQFLPVFEEVFKIKYPLNTTVELLPTVYSVKNRKNDNQLSSIFSDIALLVNKTDYYHVECQITNDQKMVIRMIEYDFHFALNNSIKNDGSDNISLNFPKSIVIYPASNQNIPKKLECTITLPNDTTFSYSVPTVRIPDYSLKDIKEKHLNLFIPFTLLQFTNRLKSKKNKLTLNELTQYTNELILILDSELKQQNLTENQCHDYAELINLAAERIFAKQPHFVKEVHAMTECLITLPSERYRKERERQQRKLDRQKRKIDAQEKKLESQEKQLESQEKRLESQEKQLESQEKQLESQEKQLESQEKQFEQLLAEKDAEIAKWKALAINHTLNSTF